MSVRINMLACSATGAVTGVLLAFSLINILASPAQAQANPAPGWAGELERPWGFGYGQETQGFDANTRDANGNRLIVDGRIMAGMDQSTLSTSSAASGASAWSQAQGGAGLGGRINSGAAIGNQLNVITQGNYNTVIVNAQQTNTGNQTTELNGRINLDD